MFIFFIHFTLICFIQLFSVNVLNKTPEFITCDQGLRMSIVTSSESDDRLYTVS